MLLDLICNNASFIKMILSFVYKICKVTGLADKYEHEIQKNMEWYGTTAMEGNDTNCIAFKVKVRKQKSLMHS